MSMTKVKNLSDEFKETSLSLTQQISEATERIRVEKIKSYQIVDTTEELIFDSIVSIASHICKTPAASISFIDDKRQWLKAKVGDLVIEMPREYSLCNITIQTPSKPLIIKDLKNSKYVEMMPPKAGEYFAERSKFDIVFYAGIPLVTPTGEAMGALCVLDEKPRKLSYEQIKQLDNLAAIVIHMLENRKVVK